MRIVSALSRLLFTLPLACAALAQTGFDSAFYRSLLATGPVPPGATCDLSTVGLPIIGTTPVVTLRTPGGMLSGFMVDLTANTGTPFPWGSPCFPAGYTLMPYLPMGGGISVVTVPDPFGHSTLTLDIAKRCAAYGFGVGS